MDNLYYEIPTDAPNMNAIMVLCVGTINTQVKSLDNNYMIIKLYYGDTQQHSVLKKYQRLTHAQAYSLVCSPKYRETINPPL